MLINDLRRIHGKMYEAKLWRKHITAQIQNIRTADTKTILFVMTPVHGNIGDHAIAETTIDLLNRMHLNYLEITSADMVEIKKRHAISEMNGKPILLCGGGNLGSLWPELDSLYQDIVRLNPKSRILCLPNTIYYDNTENDRNKLLKSAEIYNSHDSFMICVREGQSFEKVRGFYKNIMLVPDMVLSDEKMKKNNDRNGCLLCLRNDKESSDDGFSRQRIMSWAEKQFCNNVKTTDTDTDDYIPIERREKKIEEKLNEFCSAELVITDRLHGMIFSAITGTPCIVIQSKSYKIKGTYDFIKYLNYIVIAEEGDCINELYSRIPHYTCEYRNEELQHFYLELQNHIRALVE